MKFYYIMLLLLFNVPVLRYVYKNTNCTRDGLVKIYLVKQMILSHKVYVLLYLTIVLFFFIYFKFYLSVFFLVLPLLPLANRIECSIYIVVLFALIYLNMQLLSALVSICFVLYLLVIVKLSPFQYVKWHSQ